MVKARICVVLHGFTLQLSGIWLCLVLVGARLCSVV